MQQFKRDNFERAHPGLVSPRIVELAPNEAIELCRRIAERVGLGTVCDGLALVRRIAALARPIRANPEDQRFDLVALLQTLGVHTSGDVYLNWYRFDQVDRVNLRDLSAYFSDIWYPASDDIDIFDESCSWILSVSHSGAVSFLDLTNPGGEAKSSASV